MSPLLSWKFVVQGLAACGALGFTALTMYGADSAPKPRALPTHAPSHHRRVVAVAPTTPPTEPPAEVLGSDVSQASGFSNSSTGDGAGGLGSTPTGDQPATDPGPPPTVPETEFPVALPISAVVIVGLGAGGVAVARRRGSRDGPRA